MSLNAKTTISYELPPDELEKKIAECVSNGFEKFKKGVWIDYSNLPEVISRQLFCVLAGVSEEQYKSLIKNGKIKPKLKDTGNKVWYEVSRDEFWRYYSTKK